MCVSLMYFKSGCFVVKFKLICAKSFIFCHFSSILLQLLWLPMINTSLGPGIDLQMFTSFLSLHFEISSPCFIGTNTFSFLATQYLVSDQIPDRTDKTWSWFAVTLILCSSTLSCLSPFILNRNIMRMNS